METLLKDLRFALRGLLKTPGFSAAAVIALALGIGATTAIFSVVHAALLRSFGWGDESRLVSVYRTFTGIGSGKGSLSVGDLYELQNARSLESVGAFNPGTAALQGDDRSDCVQIARVTSGFFTVGMGLAIGTCAALAGARVIASQLYGVSARDPLTFLAIAALLAVVALAASGIPALRAARIQP